MKKQIKKLKKTRKILLQSLYSIYLNKDTNINELIKYKNKNKINELFLEKVAQKIIKKNAILDLIIKINTNTHANIGIIEKIILKIAIFEIFFKKNIPNKITINEAIILTKTFCPQKSYKVINKSLDKIIKNL